MSELTVDATIENLDIVTDFINEQLEQAGCGAKIIMQTDLAVEEIYVNIAHYAYHPEIGKATIRCKVDGEPIQIVIGFVDGGKPYNPLEKEKPDVTASLGERQIGGLGVFLAEKMMDELSYAFQDGKNILTICKKTNLRQYGNDKIESDGEKKWN